MTLEKLIHTYEVRLKEKENFLKDRHNDVVEGIAIQLKETLKDLRLLQQYSK